MNAVDILQDLAQIGVSIKPLPERGTVLLDPIDAVPETLKAQIVAHKPELLAVLNTGMEPATASDLTRDELETWCRFLDLAEHHGVTKSEVVDMHRLDGEIQWRDVAALVDADLEKCMETLATAIKGQRDVTYNRKVIDLAEHRRSLADCSTCRHQQLDPVNPTGGVSYCHKRPEVSGAVPPVKRECSTWEAKQ